MNNRSLCKHVALSFAVAWSCLMAGMMPIESGLSLAHAAVMPASSAAAQLQGHSAGGLARSETGLYIVQLRDPSLASYTGGIANLRATSPQATRASRLDPTTPHSRAYLDFLEQRQAEFLVRATQSLGRSVPVLHRYKGVLNALALEISHDEALALRDLNGVRAVFADTVRELQTDEGPLLIGAPQIWNGDTGGGTATRGEAIVIGVLDTGINSQHPAFAATDGDGYTHTNPYGAGVYRGWCVANPGFCNAKLIGAYSFNPVGGDPEDDDGHGSHTAGTAGGNRHIASFDVGPTPYNIALSGVAPRANIVAYKVCSPGCPGTASIAAINSAILNDEVDVLNYSISGSDNPWNDPVDLAFLDASNAGIFVAASAGNQGPGPSTVAKTGPWNAAVAASTHQRVIAHTLDVTGPSSPAALQGLAAVPGENTDIAADISGSLRFDPVNPLGCTPFSAGFFTASLALIQRGTCTFAVKVNNAVAAGATGVVLFNSVGGPPTTAGGLTGTPPVVMLELDDGIALRDYVLANPATTTIQINVATALIIRPEWQDIVGGFSSRGPSQFELLKPDFTAPGVNILAAVDQAGGDPVQYGFLQGTSMSSPHAAGAAALLMSLHPDWSPAEIRSALATTSVGGLLKEDGATPADPFDVGSGRLALGGAGRVGLVLDETGANYAAANPALGGDPKTLNQPSMVDYQCAGSCSWTRTVRSVLPVSADYSVISSAPPGMSITITPDNFNIPAGGTQVLTIEADVSGLPVDVPAFASITLETSTTWPDGSRIAPTRVGPGGRFSGDFDLANWSFTNNPAGVNGSFNTNPGPPIELFVVGGNAGTGGDSDFWIVVPEDGEISFNWGYQTSDTDCWDSGGYLVNGVYTTLACNDAAVPFFDGFVSVQVAAGDSFAFRVFTDDGAFGAGTLGITNFDFAPAGTGGSASFSSTPAAAIPDNAYNGSLASMVCDVIDASSIPAGTTISDVTVETVVAHTWVGDLTFKLQTPDGTVLALVERPQGDAATNNTGDNGTSSPVGDSSNMSIDFPLSFNDAYTHDPEHMGLGIPTSENVCQHDGRCEFFPNPDQALVVGNSVANFAALAGENASGDWTLCIGDGAGGDVGTFQAWTLTVDYEGGTGATQNVASSTLPVVVVPRGTLPAINVTPNSMAATLPPDDSTSQVLTIANTGAAPLDWTIEEAPVSLPLQLSLQGGGLDAANRAPLQLVLDDGSGENAIGVGGVQFIWFNRFSPTAGQFPVTLDRVDIMFGYPGSTGGISVGQLVDIYLYEDADGNPANGATHRASLNSQAVQATDGTTWSSYDLLAPVIFDGPGDILIAVVNRTAGVTPSTFPAVIDQSSPSQLRSWVGFGAVPGDPPVLPLPNFGIIDSFGAAFAGNWLLRGFGTFEAACDNPDDVTWLSVAPNNGTTAAGGSSNVDVTLDSTGLGAGVYEAMLCISSNDPDNPLVEVPVTLTVEALGLVPDIDVDPLALAATQAPDTTTDQALNIGNTGESTLDWTILEAPASVLVQPVVAGPALPATAAAAAVSRGGVPDLASQPVEYALLGGFGQGFEDITLLPGQGWFFQNNSSPLGTSNWFEGNPAVFLAHAGPDNAYIGANYNNTAGGTGTISNWMLTPEMVLSNGDTISFWTRTATGSTWPDRLELRLSLAGGSTDVGTLATDLGDFTTLLLSVNETLVQGGYPEVWTQYVATLTDIPPGATGRFGFRYFVTNGGPSGSNSNFIGIDTLEFVATGEPGVCEAPADVPWLSVSPDNGTTAAGETTPVQVSFDSTGLAEGVYEANLCVLSNDPDPGPGNGTELVIVPVTLTVEAAPVEPAIELVKTVGTVPGVCAATDEITVAAGTTVYYCYEVTNTGNVTLNSHDLEDDELGTIFSGLNHALTPGSSVNTVQAGLSIPAVINATTTNLATWMAYNVKGADEVTAQASATVNVQLESGISLQKTVGTVDGVCAATDEITVTAGTTVYYCYTVTNTGDVTLNLHDLDDDQLGTILNGFNHALTPGSSVSTVAAGLSIPAVINTTTTNVASWTAFNGSPTAPSDVATAQASATVNVLLPASVSGTMVVAGDFVEGGAITYTVQLSNSGPGDQGDNPGDEFVNVLPASLSLTGASASAGLAQTSGNQVRWNGAIADGASVTIQITATINPGTAGTTIANQGQISYDGTGDGVNNATALTDWPLTAAPEDPTLLEVPADLEPAIPVPTLSIWSLLTLMLLMLVIGARRQRSLQP